MQSQRPVSRRVRGQRVECPSPSPESKHVLGLSSLTAAEHGPRQPASHANETEGAASCPLGPPRANCMHGLPSVSVESRNMMKYLKLRDFGGVRRSSDDVKFGTGIEKDSLSYMQTGLLDFLQASGSQGG